MTWIKQLTSKELSDFLKQDELSHDTRKEVEHEIERRNKKRVKRDLPKIRIPVAKKRATKKKNPDA